MNKTLWLGLMSFMLLGLASAYTVGDGSCDGVESSYPVNISAYTSLYTNSEINVTGYDNSIYFETYNDTEDWYPEGLYGGVSVSDFEFDPSWEYASVDVSGVDWEQSKYSGYFVIAFCNTTTVDADEIEVCYKYYWTLDALDTEFKAGGTILDLTPTGCRWWNKSEPYYNYYDSDPCEYSDLNFSEMRAYVWAEYETLAPFSGTIGNITFGVGENYMTSYDCGTLITDLTEAVGGFENVTSGWHFVNGILDSYPTSDLAWENKVYGCRSPALGCSMRLVDNNGYAFTISYTYGSNISEQLGYRDGYHNVTVRFFTDGSTLLKDYGYITDDYGLVDGLPTVLISDYTHLTDYIIPDTQFFYLNLMTKLIIPADGYPVHRYVGTITRCRQNLTFTFDGIPMPYSVCRYMLDYTPVDSVLAYWQMYLNTEYDVTMNDTYGKTIIVYGLTQLGTTLVEPPYDWWDNFSPTDYDEVGDGICGDLETGYPDTAWNYSPDCDTEAVTGFMVAVTNMAIGLFAIVMLFGVILIMSGKLGLDLGDFSSVPAYLVVLAVASLIIFLIVYMGQLG